MDMHFVDSFDVSQISKMQELGEIEEERGTHRHPRGGGRFGQGVSHFL